MAAPEAQLPGRRRPELLSTTGFVCGHACDAYTPAHHGLGIEVIVNKFEAEVT
jgi:hypothetical protein